LTSDKEHPRRIANTKKICLPDVNKHFKYRRLCDVRELSGLPVQIIVVCEQL